MGQGVSIRLCQGPAPGRLRIAAARPPGARTFIPLLLSGQVAKWRSNNFFSVPHGDDRLLVSGLGMTVRGRAPGGRHLAAREWPPLCRGGGGPVGAARDDRSEAGVVD